LKLNFIHYPEMLIVRDDVIGLTGDAAIHELVVVWFGLN